jgi:hypothetical protein
MYCSFKVGQVNASNEIPYVCFESSTVLYTVLTLYCSMRVAFTVRFPHTPSCYIYVTVKLLSFQLILN